ncbi:conserved serine-proline rich protein [Aspergillus luchuensis IFO 4308]|nr:conserved serine-proline rich protein [Aspergillus luchuensis IFO 4308]
MFAITVRTQGTQNDNSDWDEDACSDLVNRLGKVLRRIEQLDSMQKAEVLMRAQQGGFVRWHILSAEQKTISSTYGARCVNTFQVANVENAGFKDLFEMREANQDEPSVLPGNSTMVATQLTPTPPFVPYLPMSGPKPSCPADSILLYVVPIPWMGNKNSHGHCSGGRTGQRLNVDMTPAERALSTPPSRTPLTSHPAPGIAAPAETVSTPGLYGRDSCHSTPSTMGGGPSPGERLADFGRAIRDQPSATTGVMKPHPTIIHLLQSCVDCGKEVPKDSVRKILKAERYLSPPTAPELLRPLLGVWDNNMSLGLHALGLPVVWQGLQGIVNYLRVLDADERDRFLDPVAKRIGLKPPRSYVLSCILDAYFDDPRTSKPRKARRDKISGNYVKRGKWWWMLAGTLGVGILLIGDDRLMKTINNTTSTGHQIDVLVTLALNTRPGTVRVFHTLEPVVKSLMFGWVTEDLRQAILNGGLGFFGRHEMVHAQAEDEAAVACQQIETPWLKIDAHRVAIQKMTGFLAGVPW